MDALKFFKEWERMCSSSNECAKCPFNDQECDLIRGIMEEHIVTVEKWASEHPRKTLKDTFLEKYPKAPLLYGVPNINPCCLDGDFDSPLCGLDKCGQCRKDYWMQEVE